MKPEQVSHQPAVETEHASQRDAELFVTQTADANSNQDWLARHGQVLARSMQREHDPTFGPVFVRGSGSQLWDVNGRNFLDLTCGYSATNFGHGFPPLLTAASDQMSLLTHLTGSAHIGRILLAERLLGILGPYAATQPSPAENATLTHKVLFNATGARAVESAWKAAVAFRPGKLLALAPSFHGRSIALSAISSAHLGLPALQDACYAVEPAKHYPYCKACSYGLRIENCGLRCGEKLFQLLEDHADQLAAVLIEPALGARGYIFPPAEYLQRIRRLTERAGILMIADEIQTGLGRCGDWLLSKQQAWRADLVVLGKSLGGGLVPISAVVGRADVLDAIPQGGESETFAATPLACAIALRVLHELQYGPWIEQGRHIGEKLRTWFRDLANSQNAIQAVEGCGACCVLEFVHSENTTGQATPAEQAAARQFAERLIEAGILVHLTGPQMTRVVMLPPLTLSDEELLQVKDRSAKC